MKNWIFITLLLTLSISSCQKHYKLVFPADQIGLDDSDSDGRFQIESFTVHATKKNGATAHIRGHVKDLNTKKLIDAGAVVFDNMVIPPDSHSIYDNGFLTETTNLYGKEVKVKIRDDSTSFYLPDLIKATNTEKTPNIDTIFTGFTLYWNQDDKNKHGVVLKMRIKTLNSQSLKKDKTNYEYFRRNITVKDIGYYKFKKRDLKNIPEGTMLSIILQRSGGTTLMTSANEKITIIGTSQNMKLVRYVSKKN